MSKILQGKVISNKMNNTAVVEVERIVPHPLYKKLLKRSKRYKVETKGQKLEIGETVKIVETRPISKDKHFAIFTDEKKPEEGTTKIKTTNTKKEKKA
jgi:small subunit ribosomal protein S17